MSSHIGTPTPLPRNGSGSRRQKLGIAPGGRRRPATSTQVIKAGNEGSTSRPNAGRGTPAANVRPEQVMLSGSRRRKRLSLDRRADDNAAWRPMM